MDIIVARSEINCRNFIENTKEKLKMKGLEHYNKYLSIKSESKKKMDEKISNYISKMAEKHEKMKSFYKFL